MTAEEKKAGEIFLIVMGVGLLVWLIFRHKGTQTAIAPGGVPVSLPSVGAVPPDYLTYNVPALGKTSLPGVSPIAAALPSVAPFSWNAPTNNTATSAPSCACSDSSGQTLFSNLGNLVNYYTHQASGLTSNYAANILSAFPSASALIAASGFGPNRIMDAGGSNGPPIVGTVPM